jgi:hypothetical protein
MQTIYGVLVDAEPRDECADVWTDVPTIPFAFVHGLLEGEHRARRIFFDSNLLISATEENYVQYEVFAFRERALRKQQLIERELRVARQTRNRALYLECRRDLNKLNRQFWNLGSVLKSKILVKRKGTERSRSRSGSQTICTHTIPIFEEDSEQRWLVGLAVEISRAANVRNKVQQRVPIAARPEASSLTQCFATAKTDVRQSQFRIQVSAATLFRERKQMGANRLRRGSDFPSGGENYHCYSFDRCQRVCRYDTLPFRMVRLRNLDGGNGHLRMAPRLFITS